VSLAASLTTWVGVARAGEAEAQARLNDVLFSLVPLVSAGLAALIVSRHPRNTIGWLLMTQGVGQALAGPVTAFLRGITSAPAQPGALLLLALWFENMSWLFLIFPLFLIPLLFPNGRPLSRRWNWVVGLGVGMCLFLMTASAFSQWIGPVDGAWMVRNPIGFLPVTWFEPIMVPWTMGLAALTGFGPGAVLLRYRGGSEVERQQIKWLVFGCAVFAAVYAPSLWLAWVETSWAFSSAWQVLFVPGLMAIPLSIAMAILRYRLWDIDVIIRRTLVYSVLTALLGLMYFGSVLALQALLRGVSGGETPVVIVLSTLLIAALAAPLRRRVQAVIDRRFYRRKYDAARTLAAFGEQARDETDLERLSARLRGVVEETVQPESVGLWLRGKG
jgi:hypothetical protein